MGLEAHPLCAKLLAWLASCEPPQGLLACEVGPVPLVVA